MKKTPGCYSFVKNNIKIIVFNNTAPDESTNAGKFYVDKVRYEWLNIEMH